MELEQHDDDWMIEKVDRARGVVEIRNLRYDTSPILGFDQIHSYMSDPTRDLGGQKHGFLRLDVQVLMTDTGVRIEPLPGAPGRLR